MELSLEVTIALFHVAILLKRYKEIDENKRSNPKFHNHFEIAVLLNDLTFGNDENFKINPFFLAHGTKLLGGKLNFWSNFFFEVGRVRGKDMPVKRIGELNGIERAVTLAFPGIIGSEMASDKQSLLKQIHIQKNELVSRLYGKDRFSEHESLSSCLLLQFNSDTYLEMLNSQEALEENTELKAELKSLRQQYETETLTSSSKSSLLKSPRDIILSGNQNAEVDKYLKALKELQMNTLVWYGLHGMPSFEQRYSLVTQHMKSLYKAIFNAVTSKHHFEDSRSSRNKIEKEKAKCKNFSSYINLMNSYGGTAHRLVVEGAVSAEQVKKAEDDYRFEERAWDVARQAVELCEIIAGQHAYGSCVTPALVSNGMLNLVTGQSQTGMDIQSQKSTAICRTSSKDLLRLRLKYHQEKVIANIKENDKNPQLLNIHNMDNYVTMQWQKFKNVSKTFTNSCPTISILVNSQKYDPSKRPRDGGESPCRLLEKEKMITLLLGGLTIPPELQDIVDPNHGYQGLRDWAPVKNLSAKSSSISDCDTEVVKGYLEEIADMKNKPQGLVVDTEFILLFYQLANRQPERLKNCVMFAAIFHIRMHLIQNVFTDPVNMIMIFIPYMYSCLNLQRTSWKKTAQDLLNKMELCVASGQASKKTKRQRVVHIPEDNDDQDMSSSNSNTGTTTGTPLSRKHSSESTVFDWSNTSNLSSKDSYVQRAKDYLNDVYLLGDNDDDDQDANEEEPIPIIGENGGTTPLDINPHSEANEELFDLSDLNIQQNNLFNEEEWAKATITCHKFIELGYRDIQELFSYKDKKGRCIRYARMLNAVQWLVHCYSIVLEDKDFLKSLDDKTDPDNPSWALMVHNDVISSQLKDMCIVPFSDIVLKGRGHNMISKMSVFCNYLSSCSRDKVCRSLFCLINTYDVMLTTRPDLGAFMIENITKFQDNNIENHNASTCALLPTNTPHTVELIGEAALKTQVKREFLGQQKDLYGMSTGLSSSKNRGEIVHEETRHLRGAFANQKYTVVEWIKRRMIYLVSLKFGAEIPKKCINGMDMLDGLIKFGRIRNENVVLPAYLEYLKKDKEEYDRIATRSTYQENDMVYLTSHELWFLQGYLISLKKETKGSKDSLAKRILNSSSASEFALWIARNKLHFKQNGKDYLEMMKRKNAFQAQEAQNAKTTKAKSTKKTEVEKINPAIVSMNKSKKSSLNPEETKFVESFITNIDNEKVEIGNIDCFTVKTLNWIRKKYNIKCIGPNKPEMYEAIMTFVNMHKRPKIPEMGTSQIGESSRSNRDFQISSASNHTKFGLPNLGNTCYINSLMQMLYYCPGCRQLLNSRISQNNEESGADVDDLHILISILFKAMDCQDDDYERKIFALKRMLPLLGHKGREEDVFECLDSKIIDLWSSLFEFDLLPESLVDAGTFTPADLAYYKYVSIGIAAHDMLLDCIEEFLEPPDDITLGEDNQEISRKKKFFASPKILLIQIKRFNARGKKVCTKLEFSRDLTINNDRYTLQGIIIHKGKQLFSGHYYGYNKSERGTWMKCDDKSVDEILSAEAFFEQAKQHFIGEDSAYLLLYIRPEWENTGVCHSYPLPEVWYPATALLYVIGL